MSRSKSAILAVAPKKRLPCWVISRAVGDATVSESYEAETAAEAALKWLVEHDMDVRREEDEPE